VVGAETATIGVVRRDGLVVEAVDEPTIVATYETDSPEPYALAAADAETPDAAAAATEVLGADFEHPVCAAGATVDADGATLAFDNDAGVANRPRRLRWGAALDPSGDRIERIIRCFDGCSEHHDAPRALDRSDEEGLSAGKEEDEE